MRVLRDRSQGATVLSSILFPSLVAAAVTLDCSHVRVDKESFNLESLGGPHSVLNSIVDGPRFHNTTFTVDICAPLKRSSKVPKDEECPNGARVCAIERLINTETDLDTISTVTTIAGNLADVGGSSLEPSWELLTNSNSNSDLDKEGLRLTMEGGYAPLTGKNRRPQKAIIEFLCDPNRTGLEGNYEGEDKYQNGNEERADEGEGEDGGDGEQENPASLRFIRYGPSSEGSDTDILRLEWLTKYACEGKRDEDLAKSGWGFFTWFIIILFLGTASYLIFGSWLNYNRYGARGWDMLPHGDTIRDLPYLMQDWTRKVVNTVQSGGSRGGYSAV